MKTKIYFLLATFYVISQFTVLSQDNYILWIRDQGMDSSFIDTLVNRGFSVEVKTAAYQGELDQTKLDSLNAARLVVVSRSTKSDVYSVNITQWNGITAPMICFSPWLLRNTRWMWFNAGAADIDTIISDEFTSDLILKDLEDPIFNGISIPLINMYLEPGCEIIGVPNAGNGKVLAVSLTTSNVAIASWEAGQEFYPGSGQTAAGKRIFFSAGHWGTPAGSAGFNLTETGKNLFINAVMQFYPELGTGINENNTLNSISVYPNPAFDILKIDFHSKSDKIAFYSIIDIAGKVVYKNTADLRQTGHHLDINISSLNDGLYLLKLSIGGKELVRKFEVK